MTISEVSWAQFSFQDMLSWGHWSYLCVQHLFLGFHTIFFDCISYRRFRKLAVVLQSPVRKCKATISPKYTVAFPWVSIRLCFQSFSCFLWTADFQVNLAVRGKGAWGSREEMSIWSRNFLFCDKGMVPLNWIDTGDLYGPLCLDTVQFADVEVAKQPFHVRSHHPLDPFTQSSVPTHLLPQLTPSCQHRAPNHLPGREIWTLIFIIADMKEYIKIFNRNPPKDEKWHLCVGPRILSHRGLVMCRRTNLASNPLSLEYYSK